MDRFDMSVRPIACAGWVHRMRALKVDVVRVAIVQRGEAMHRRFFYRGLPDVKNSKRRYRLLSLPFFVVIAIAVLIDVVSKFN
ncbi:hypothetical protein BLA50215_07784 [Burkholderia lata]|nr:hypothetical protein BLA50215_07784 [Burkholderia lata]